MFWSQALVCSFMLVGWVAVCLYAHTFIRSIHVCVLFCLFLCSFAPVVFGNPVCPFALLIYTTRAGTSFCYNSRWLFLYTRYDVRVCPGSYLDVRFFVRLLVFYLLVCCVSPLHLRTGRLTWTWWSWAFATCSRTSTSPCSWPTASLRWVLYC